MCGIVGYIGKNNALPIILSGLESLEYRGYDSAGIAYKLKDKVIINKEKGRIENLKSILKSDISNIGIGHTRWATHGIPSEKNSHPHKVGKITLVHNGIIENYKELKEMLFDYKYKSDTDSEVVAALIDKLYKEDKDILKVLNKLKKYLVGSYALGIIVDGIDKIYCIRKDSPLIIGVSDDGYFIASDVPAILKYTNKYYLLLNNEYAELDNNGVKIFNEENCIDKEINIFSYDIESAMKNGYDHFMLKEIFEQPKVVKDTLSEYISNINVLNNSFSGLEKYEEIDIVGCGSAYNVGLVGKYLITKYSKIRVNVDIASEYRYMEHVYSKKHLVILISQSGETADTLAVLRSVKELGIDTLGIVNVVGSSIAREVDKVIYIKAGVEVAVATTKAYICQYVILSLIAYYLGLKNGLLDETVLNDFKNIDKYIEEELDNINNEISIAEELQNASNIFYLGRKIDYAYCLEASLKLKEISYIHSEAYQAGELKHGSISLIHDNVPVISIVTEDDVKFKTLSNIKEVCARNANSIIITNDSNIDMDLYNKITVVPKINDLLQGVLIIIKCQIIAYYVAKLRGCDIDKPRNLAKSVTVE